MARKRARLFVSFSAIRVINGNKRATKIVEGLLFVVLVVGKRIPPTCTGQIGGKRETVSEIRRGAFVL